jgi:hypothetical protein
MGRNALDRAIDRSRQPSRTLEVTLNIVPIDCVSVSALVDADGSVAGAEYPQDQVSELKVQPFGGGRYDVSLLTNVDVISTQPVVAAEGRHGEVSVTDVWSGYSASADYPHEVTVRVETSPNTIAGGFRLRLRLG